MTPQIARRVVLRMKGKESAKRILGELTPRENEVLEQLALGARYKEICDQLDLSFDTVRFHIRHIYEKLRVHSRTEAVIKYLAERPPKP
jgi:DNA-binding NarL/FixJ family response regulator